MLRVIEDGKTIAACQAVLAKAVRSRATKSKPHVVGYPGGASSATIHFIPSLDFWMAFEKASNRYFNPCGVGDPFAVATPAPHLEINFPLKGIDRRIGGTFLEDENGVRYVAHSGKVGGGTKGVSLTNFLTYYPAFSTVDSGGQALKVYVLGRLDDPRLVEKIAAFTKVSAEFRALVRAGKLNGSSSSTAATSVEPPVPAFSPEFAGTKVYTTAEKVEAECTHGLVVKALREKLAAAGFNAGNTSNRDLYLAGNGGAMLALFEVKTLADTTSIYGCVGQLLVHGGAGAASHLVAVLPEDLDGKASSRLGALGLHVLTFARDEQAQITFDGFDALLTTITKARRSC